MKPRSFPQANRRMMPPAGVANCDPLETFIDVDPLEGPVTISHWQMSAEELAECNRNGGRVWLRVLMVPTPPVAVEVFDPWEPRNDDGTPR